jgi:GNAT superfamily N-acetyltransferase
VVIGSPSARILAQRLTPIKTNRAAREDLRVTKPLPRSRDISLRDARPEDAAELVRVLIRTKEESFSGPIDPHDRDFDFWHDRWRRYLQEGSRAQKSLGDGFAILAQTEGELVGFAGYHHTRRWECDAELESIYVRLSHQGRGVGTRLLREILQRLRADGSRSLCVGYRPDNPYKRFYFKHGAIEINPHWAVWRRLPGERL